MVRFEIFKYNICSERTVNVEFPARIRVSVLIVSLPDRVKVDVPSIVIVRIFNI